MLADKAPDAPRSDASENPLATALPAAFTFCRLGRCVQRAVVGFVQHDSAGRLVIEPEYCAEHGAGLLRIIKTRNEMTTGGYDG